MKRIVWTALAKTDVRRLDKTTAMRILAALHRFADSGEGDVKALQGMEELRLGIQSRKMPGFPAQTAGTSMKRRKARRYKSRKAGLKPSAYTNEARA